MTLDEIAQGIVDVLEEERRINWRLGDLTNLAGPGSAPALATLTGAGARRLQQAGLVSRTFSEDDRAALHVPWSYFRVVANLPHDEAVTLLAKASDEQLSATAFGRLLKDEPEPEVHECPDCGKSHRKAGD